MAQSNDELKENVINAVQAYPFLYDMTSRDHKHDKDLINKENAWQALPSNAVVMVSAVLWKYSLGLHNVKIQFSLSL